MSKHNWFDIWSKRSFDRRKKSVLAGLLAADGMDTGFGHMPEQSWIKFCAHVASVLNIDRRQHTLLEVGCGAGAFLYPFYQAGHEVQGIDQSQALIDIAQEHLPTGRFAKAFADCFVAQSADIVLSMGVFMYFSDLLYAQKVLRQMDRYSISAMAILDIPDADKQKQALEFRRSTMTKDEYQAKYAGLNHLYYRKEWIVDQLKSLGYGKIIVAEQQIEGYQNAAFRFNVFAFRSD